MNIIQRIKYWLAGKIFIGQGTGVMWICALNGDKRIQGFKRYIHEGDTVIVIPRKRKEPS